MLLVKEKRKGKQYSTLREEVTTIVDLMDLTISIAMQSAPAALQVGNA
jgi:hypothetical protein